MIKETPSLSNELLKQDGLARNEGSGTLLEMMRSVQAKAEQRERFWFRIACSFWIVAGVCILLLAILGSFEAHSFGGIAGNAKGSAEGTTVPVPGGQTEASFHFHPVRTPFFAALVTLPFAILGGIFSAVWLVFTRREAGQATLQMTVAALTKEIRDLKDQRGEETGKPA